MLGGKAALGLALGGAGEELAQETILDSGDTAWMVVGNSLAFSDGGGLNSFVGGLDKAFLAGMGTAAGRKGDIVALDVGPW